MSRNREQTRPRRRESLPRKMATDRDRQRLFGIAAVASFTAFAAIGFHAVLRETAQHPDRGYPSAADESITNRFEDSLSNPVFNAATRGNQAHGSGRALAYPGVEDSPPPYPPVTLSDTDILRKILGGADISDWLAGHGLNTEDEARIERAWLQVLHHDPDAVKRLLAKDAHLLNTMSPPVIDELAQSMGDALVDGSILELEDMEALRFDRIAQIMGLMFTADAGATTRRALSLPADSRTKAITLTVIVGQWEQHRRSGADFMAYVYDLQDPELDALLAEHFGDSNFTDLPAQLEWIIYHDWKQVFTPQYPALAQRFVQSADFYSLQQFLDTLAQGAYRDQLAAAALAHYASDPSAYGTELAYLRSL